MTPERFQEFCDACPNGFTMLKEGERIPSYEECDVLKSYHAAVRFVEHKTTGGPIYDLTDHVVIAYRKRQAPPEEW